MTTLLWDRPTAFDVKSSKQLPGSQYNWTPEISVHKRQTYRIVVDASPEVIQKLLSLESITAKDFPYKPLRKPTKVFFHGMTYDLYSLKKGAPR